MTMHPKFAEFEPTIAGQKVINLALQGGGSHGAFTWGVLDRLLEEEQLTIDGITATSAGSINAVLLAYGLSVGGREEAKRTLEHFWRRMSAMTASSLFQPSIFDKMSGSFGLDFAPGYVLTNMFCQLLSPYQLNPFNLNPLKHLLEEVVDFQRLRRQTAVNLFLGATNVRSCKLKVFCGRELTADHVLASSCLPFLMHAVEIDGEHYWDGGFIGNPAFFPVIYECEARDIILVHLTPIQRQDVPTTASSILSRMQEISLNSSLVREMRAVAFVNKLIDQRRMIGGKKIVVHVIEADGVIRDLPNTSKMNADWDFLLHLHSMGRRCANDWLCYNVNKVGMEPTVDMAGKFL